MEFIPAQELIVARYATKVTRIEDFADQDVRGWLTINRSARDGNMKRTPWALRILPDYVEEINSNFPQALIAMDNSRNVGCLNGIALLNSRIKITTLGGLDRPRELYRAIHSGQPGDGITSRLGRGSDAVFFHHHLRRHLRWQSREASPFLSATNDLKKAVRIAAIYVAKGFDDVRIIRFNTQGPGWDHNLNRMWNPRKLARMLSPRDDKKYLDNEVLIEHSIPKDSILETYRWQEHKAHLDPSSRTEARAKAVQLTRDKIKVDRQEKAQKLCEDNSKKAAEEKQTKGKAEAQDKMKPQHDAEESAKKRKANDDEGEESAPVATRLKRFKIGQKMTANSSR
ncbi:hypothetical protein CGCSCA4_v012532 [Colletotrichum siamense]|uniref:DUF7587 domain-containing protein n=1 Tax=Colletotrichum siamense TaxID=690259 RepID=A0A9P5BNL3_COLSI|nr:hypothetical protein CGCSCA5_v012686 [Colletotrichum siamense]KAF4835948.1 hypothetical protein CGCSCA4_v012532 [Colletotrichum siamense]KAF4845598.1 hypothetical protein CGCSCA2_v013535 [Colletotrichum siamense]KAF4867794.1 hypothetical protein CGCSCA1_v013023 [Colletotrichum siamense]